MGEKKPVDLSFPVKGLDENWAYKAQPEGTSPDCLNVRPYDPIAARLRGGSRPGISKYFASAVNGSNPIQRMGYVIESIVGGPTTTTETFTQGDGQLAATNWNDLEETFASAPNFVTSVANPRVTGNRVVLNNTTHPASFGMSVGIHKTVSIGAGVPFTISADVTLVCDSADNATIQAGVLVKVPAAPSFPLDQGFTVGPYVQIWVYPAIWPDPGPHLYVGMDWGSSLDLGLMTPGSGDFMDPAYWTTPRTISFRIATSSSYPLSQAIAGSPLCIEAYIGGVFVGAWNPLDTFPNTWSIANPGVGFYLSKTAEVGNAITLDNWAVTTGNPLSNRKPKIVVVSGGSIYSGTKGAGLVAATTGTSVLTTLMEKVHMTDILGKMYLVDGTNYVKWDNATNTASTWTATAGTLPVSAANTCRLIASYRGRVVLSGLVDDPQNWFMSKVGDPLDFDYGATVSAVMAVAGNNSVAGKCPDIITCLAPLSDDLMVIGGDHTLWIMRGDPADGGRIDNLSQQMGILGPDSYCTDPTGVFYFFGNGVLWKMIPGSTPEPMSRGRLDKTFGAIDYSTHTVKLVWDETFHGIHIYVVPTASGPAYHYWWDVRLDGFWKDQFPAAQGPTCTMVFDADAPNDRVVMLGGWDSYVRQSDATARTDDGTTILSRVKFGPMTPGGVHQNTKLHRIITRLDGASDPVTLKVYAANSPDLVVAAASPIWATEVSAIAPYSMPRIAANSLLFELTNNTFSAVWVTGHVYTVGNQVVAADGNPYVALTAHTSTTSGAHDTPPGNSTDWILSAFRYWALEGISAILDVTGRTRHGRL
jgi:hypothetical protein